MKIGILTYHRVVNVGATLQAYCVSEFYRSLQHEVTLIDLRNRSTEWNEFRKLINVKKLRFNFNQLDKLRNTRVFVNGNFNLSSVIRSGNTKNFAKFCDRQNFDLISVGSDTVWELRAGGYSSLDTNEYFLEHYTGTKISFSASMDPVLYSKEFDLLMPARTSAIKQFGFVGVRDEPTKEALESFGVSTSFTCDPTIVMMMHPIFQLEDVQRNGTGLQLKEGPTKQLTSDIFDECIDVNGHRSSRKKFDANFSVPEYLAALNKNRILITDRFHGTILTLLVSKAKIPVIMYEDPEKWQSNKSKLRDLAERLGLTDYICTSLEQVKERLSDLEKGRLLWDSSKLYQRLIHLSENTSVILKNKLDDIAKGMR